MGKFCVGDTTEHLTMMLSALVVAATAVTAVPVERTNGVLSTVYRDDFELSNNQHHFVAFNRGCPGCGGGLVPHPFAYRYPYHLTDAYEERGLVKRSPKNDPFSKFGKKTFFKLKKGGKKGGKKGKKGFKKTAVPPFNKPFKGFSKFAGKNSKKAFKGFSKAAKKSSPISIPAIGLGGGGGGGALAIGIPAAGFALGGGGGGGG